MTHPSPSGTDGATPATRMMRQDRASAGAGLQVLSIGAGAAAVRMTIRDDMVNGHGVTHGGYIFLLADTAFACACNGDDGVTVAAGADITFLAATGPGDVLVARADLRSRRGRSGVYDVTVTRETGEYREDGEVIAEFRGRSRTLPRPPAADAAAPPPLTDQDVTR